MGPGDGRHRLGPSDQLLRGAAEVALAVARRRLSDDPPIPAPRRLLPFLGFAHLPERALAAFRRVLEEDEGLRSATRDATDEASVGRASWLFLDRPEGWEDELDLLGEAANEMAADVREQREGSVARRRLQAEEEVRRRAEGEVAHLAQELGEVKELLAAERRARRRAESDAGRLRRRYAELTAEIEERRRTESALRLALEDAREEVAANTGGDGGGGGRAGSAAAPADGDVGVEAREDQEVWDHRALTSAVGEATSALVVLSSALAEATRLLVPDESATTGPPGRPPRPRQGERSGPAGGTRRRPVPLPPGMFDDSVAAVDHLVRVGRVLVVVDGYNVTKLARPDLSLPEQRRWLVDAAVELAARTGAHLELVFDGAGERASAPADLGRRMGVQVRFSPAGTEADDLVLDLVAHTSVTRPVVVASDDRRVQDGARRLGANVVTSPQLLAVVRRPI